MITTDREPLYKSPKKQKTKRTDCRYRGGPGWTWTVEVRIPRWVFVKSYVLSKMGKTKVETGSVSCRLDQWGCRREFDGKVLGMDWVLETFSTKLMIEVKESH